MRKTLPYRLRREVALRHHRRWLWAIASLSLYVTALLLLAFSISGCASISSEGTKLDLTPESGEASVVGPDLIQLIFGPRKSAAE